MQQLILLALKKVALRVHRGLIASLAREDGFLVKADKPGDPPITHTATSMAP